MYFGQFDSTQLILIFAAAAIALFASSRINATYKKYVKLENLTGMTGAQIATDILNKQGYTDVKVNKTSKGVLSDNFNPSNMTVNLSPEVYSGKSIAAAAVAAHEVGHAIQHKTKYVGISIRDTVLPLAIVSSNVSWGVIMLGFVFSSPNLINIGIILISVIALFQLLTLPIEFDASKRALKLLPAGGYVKQEQVPQAKEMLNAAAFTYVAALISTLLTILRLVLISRGRD